MIFLVYIGVKNQTFRLRLEFVLSFKEKKKQTPIPCLFPVLPFGKMTLVPVLHRLF